MVYTLTCSPSVEYAAEVEEFLQGIRNCSKNERVVPGGKGIHSAKTLRSLGVRNTILGFSAGFTGDFLERELREKGIETAFIRLEKGFSRVMVKILGQEESEIIGSMPEILPKERDGLLVQLDRLQKGDILILSGDDAPDGLYEQILKRLAGRDVFTIVDTSGETLPRILRQKPFLIKPNKQELEDFAGRRLFTWQEMLREGRRMQELGAENVLISLAAEGAVLLSGKDVLCGEAPRGEAFRPAGAGDAMLAGAVAGWLRTGSLREALRLGIAAGSASVFCRGQAEEIQRFYDEIVIRGMG